MLKEFLNLFRHGDEPTEAVEHPHLQALGTEQYEDSTYLEFLFDQIRPRVAQRLDEYPETDPVLEVATGIFAELFPEYWDEPDGALVDQWTPGNRTGGNRKEPPSTPPAPPKAGGPPTPPGADSSTAPPTPPDGLPKDGAFESSDTDDEIIEVDEFDSVETIDSADSDGQDEASETDDESSKPANEDESPDSKEGVDGESDSGEDTTDDENPEDNTDQSASDDEQIAADSDDELSDEQNGADDQRPKADRNDSDPMSSPDAEKEEAQKDGESSGEEIHEIDDLGAAEEETVETDPPAGFVSALDDTAEFEPPPVKRTESSSTVWPKSLGEPGVLHGARVLLAVLLDNDRLPVEQQLSVGEIVMASDLWAHLVVRASGVDERVQALAQLVEEKFGANDFSQARLLLKLFPANRETQLNNDRQLFFEDMIMRMGVRRQHTGASGAKAQLGETLAELELDDDQKTKSSLAQLADTAGIYMHVYTRGPTAVDRWRNLVEATDRPEVVSYFLDKIPPRRWRKLPRQGGRTIRTALREHLVRPMVRDYVIEHLKTCYFVLRTVGDTGLEPYLDPFFDWSETCFDQDPLEFLDDIQNRISTEREMTDSVFQRVYDQYYRQSVQSALTRLDDEVLGDAFSLATRRMSDCDLSEIASGHFDLGGFILDAYFEFEYPQPEFPFKIHRLT